MSLPHPLKNSSALSEVVIALILLSLAAFSIIPQKAEAVTTNQFKALLGEEGALFSAAPIPIPYPRETYWFWVWRTAIDNMLNDLQLEGKYVSKFDVLYEIGNHPTYDPDWLKSEVINAIDTAVPNSNLIIFGHMDPSTYIPYRFIWAHLMTSFNSIPPSWAIPGDVAVTTGDVNTVTLSKPVDELPGLIILIGCKSLPDYAVNTDFSWAHTFKLSTRFYPYTIYWNQRGILGFNNTISYTDTAVLSFISKVLDYSTSMAIGDAIRRAGEESRVNVVLEYYTGRYTHSTDNFDYGGGDTAVFVGDYYLTVDPTFDTDVAERVIGYIRTRYPLLYSLLSNVSDGLIYVRAGKTPLNFPGFGQVTQLEMKFRKNMTEPDAEVFVWLSAYLWNDNILSLSITMVIKPHNSEAADWARELGDKTTKILEKTVIPSLMEKGLNPEVLNRSKPPDEIDLMVVPKIGNVTVYVGGEAPAYTAVQIFDRVGLKNLNYLTIGFTDTPYLTNVVIGNSTKGFMIPKMEAIKSLGLGNAKPEIIKAYAIMPQGLVPAYIIRYSDDAGAHIRVVDASTGTVLYSSDGNLGGTAAPLSTLGQGPSTMILIGAATAASAILIALFLLRRQKSSS